MTEVQKDMVDLLIVALREIEKSLDATEKSLNSITKRLESIANKGELYQP